MRKAFLILSSLVFSASLLVPAAYADSNQNTIAPIPYKVSIPTSSKDKNGVTHEKATAYIKSLQVKNGKLMISLDYVQWFFGDEARKAYRQDNPKAKEEYPLEYYIRNSSAKIRTFEVSPKAAFILQTNSTINDNFRWNESVHVDTFKKFVLTRGIRDCLPFHVEVTNGVVTKITEQYVP